MTKFYRYLSYVLRHKWFVFVECCKYGIFWRGLTHDISKLRPSEFFPYMNYFGGSKNAKRGRDKTGYYKPYDTGDYAFECAWLKHANRNDHHWQWWTLTGDGGVSKVYEMALDARKEMVADWRGAGRAQGTPDTLAWYTANKDKLFLGEETRAWVEKEVGYAV